jgi:molybdate transport system regulatory protein
MGAFRLLVLVDSTGSLSRAATEMGMAYSKAWQSIRQAEAAVGFQLIERRAGGRGGGGSSLSPKGRWLVAAFSALQDEATETIRLLGEKHLRDWPARAGEAAPSTPAGPLGKVRLGGA